MRDSAFRFSSLVLAAALCGAALGAEAAGERSVKVVCFGDSITFGYASSDPATKSYPAVLQRLLDEDRGAGALKVINSGLSGEDTRQALKRIDAVLSEHEPDWVLVAYGANDLWSSRRIPPEETQKNLAEMLAKIKAAGARTIVATLPPVGGMASQVDRRNACVKKAAESAGAPLVDLNAAFETAIRRAGGREKEESWLRYYSDEETFLHPNDFGYAFLARVWLEALGGLLASADDEPVTPRR